MSDLPTPVTIPRPATAAAAPPDPLAVGSGARYAPPGGDDARARRIDARPILARRDDDIWSKVDAARDTLFDAARAAVAAEGVELQVVKSPPFSQPAWVRLEGWMPHGDALVTERSSVLVTIEAREYHRFPVVYSLTLVGRGRTRHVGALHTMREAQVRALMPFLLGRAPAPRFGAESLRRSAFQFWRPANRLTVLRPDWAAVGAGTLLALGGVRLALGAMLPATPEITYTADGIPQVVEAAAPSSSLRALDAGLVAGGVAGVWLLGRRRRVVRSSGRPASEPRQLLLVDSWQTVVAGLGDALPVLAARLMEGLQRPGGPTGLRVRTERIWYWGLDGVEERDQVVLTLNRALCFLHCYAYGSELYVGWDGHLNRGQWVESRIASGIDRATSALVEVRTVRQGEQPLSEYDVTDANCLMEWAHVKLTTEVKRLMSERRIDQEIDFRIQRGARQSLTDDRRTAAGAAGSLGSRVVQRLVRTG